MKIKVCGMKNPENIKELITLPIDMIGFIFYEKSPRYAGNLDLEALKIIPDSIRKVGVFVDETIEKITTKIREYDLSMVQLHGIESPSLCNKLKAQVIKDIKSFSIEEKEDLKECVFYENACDYFLFDTKTPQYGGSGKKFDWQILSYFQSEKPFFLSGGIGMEDMDTINQLKIPQLYAIDLNSKFEIEPGIKDISKLKEFVKQIFIC
jgi:phosphoribosylanthranilate isomerase